MGNPFLQLGTVGDLLNLQMQGTFSIYNKGPLSGVAIIRVKSDLKKPSGSSSYAAVTLTPSKCVIGPDSHTRIDIVYRPRKNDVRKLLRQEGNVLGKYKNASLEYSVLRIKFHLLRTSSSPTFSNSIIHHSCCHSGSFYGR